MNNKVSPIPKGYHTITPFLIVDDAKNAIEFYKNVFDAIEIMRFDKPDGKIGHAELKIGNSRIMLADECHSMNALSPKSYNGSPIGMHLYVEDVDAIVNKAVSTGAKIIRPVEDMFYGDRTGTLEDPYGHIWSVATHIEDLTNDEINQRAVKLYSK